LGQVVFPWTLSGDYSYRAETAPPRPVVLGSVLGAVLLVLPPLVALGLWIKSAVVARAARTSPLAAMREAAGPWALAALGAFWFPIAYFPHSNIPVLLPTVRAERFWYLPVVGTSMMIALLCSWLLRGRSASFGAALVGAFFGVQAFQARAHALDYVDDLSFWDATRRAVPESAKAQLNYSVMLGARGKLEERLHYNRIAKQLAPQWAMAHVYYGDTLCRLAAQKNAQKPVDANTAISHYYEGFELAPNDPNLIALALQCMWEQGLVRDRKAELAELASRHPGTWLSFLVTDILDNGEKHGGVQKKYRPRSYDEGPKAD
jgi:hypothetical protein